MALKRVEVKKVVKKTSVRPKEDVPEAPGEAKAGKGIEPTRPPTKAPAVFQDANGWWKIRGFEDSPVHKFGNKAIAEKVASRIARYRGGP